MRLLLDTHSWLWAMSSPERLRPESQLLLERTDVEVLLSVACIWEIAIKHALGKLVLPEPPEVVVRICLEGGLIPLPILHPHALRAAALPAHHRDPFGRLLIAQAQLEGIPILTADPLFDPYDVETIPA